MANSKGPSSIRSMMYNGKSSLLPPKSPFPSLTPAYTEYIPTSTIGQKPIPKPREGNSNHQRTSSESFLIDEQPSWLDELLDEPETPVHKRGHRRSSSDSFAYLDSSMNYTSQDDYHKYKNVAQVPSRGPQDFDFYRDTRQSSFNKPWDAHVSSLAPPRCVPLHRGKIVNSQDADRNPSSSIQKQAVAESGPQDQQGPTEEKDSLNVKSLDVDTKRAKQQFAQRSRVRKLQYIAELERNVQALQAEGGEVSASLKFLNQQNLILNMENKSLKQRLENLAQEQLIKYLEHEVLEREVGRLRSSYQQQQQQQPHQQQMSSNHRRANSRDLLDQQFATLSLKHKESSPGRDSVSS